MLLLILLTMLSLATGAPKSAIYVDDRAQNYLMKFGYLPQSDLETGNLRDEHQLRDAIKKLQKYGGIPATGEIDTATKKLMTARRCGLPDEPDPRYEKTRKRRFKRFTIHGQQWHHLNLTWSLRTNGGLETGRVRRELGRALDLWARNSKLTFQEINSDNADILISFHKGYHGDGYPFDGKGQILAHAFFPGKDRGGDAHFDEEESWLLQHNSNDEEEGTSLFAVAAHEFGHSLGLAHSSVRGALMYPWYQGLSPNYELPEDDRHGIQQMYGAQEGKLWGIIPGVSSPTTPTTRTMSSTASTPTTYRPWRTRPTRPNHYPEDRPRTSPSPRYPSRTGRPDYHPQRPNYWPHQPHKPHRHHTTSTTTTTTTTLAPTTHRTRHHWTPTTRDDVPDKCDTTYDAISVIRREIFIFKGRYLWRIGDRGLYEGYPAEIIRLFNLPKIIDHVDAVYERPDKKIVFFIGKLYYVFNANKLEPGYPKPLWTLGLPKSLEKIDGAMVWGHNGRTYFFSGTMYWRFDESINYVELDYPRDMSMFAGVGYYIDAVFQWNNGKTYFFKDKGFWEFDDMRMKVAHEKPKQSASFWMGCPKEEDTNDIDAEIPKKFYPAVTYSSSKRKDATSIIIVVTIFSALLSYNLSNV